MEKFEIIEIPVIGNDGIFKFRHKAKGTMCTGIDLDVSKVHASLAIAQVGITFNNQKDQIMNFLAQNKTNDNRSNRTQSINQKIEQNSFITGYVHDLGVFKVGQNDLNYTIRIILKMTENE